MTGEAHEPWDGVDRRAGDRRAEPERPPPHPAPRLDRVAVIAICVASLIGIVFIACSTIALIKVSDAVDAVQASRIEICEQTNRRHDEAISRTNARVLEMPKSQRDAAEEGRLFTISLIEAITPRRDCDEALKPIATR